MKMATEGGAHCGFLGREVGKVTQCMKADMVLLDLNSLSFFPRNSLLRQLVFCENGRSVDTVIIDGNIIVEGGKILTINEQKVISELMELEDEIREKIRRASARGSELGPFSREVYFEGVKEDVGFVRNRRN